MGVPHFAAAFKVGAHARFISQHRRINGFGPLCAASSPASRRLSKGTGSATAQLACRLPPQSWAQQLTGYPPFAIRRLYYRLSTTEPWTRLCASARKNKQRGSLAGLTRSCPPGRKAAFPVASSGQVQAAAAAVAALCRKPRRPTFRRLRSAASRWQPFAHEPLFIIRYRPARVSVCRCGANALAEPRFGAHTEPQAG